MSRMTNLESEISRIVDAERPNIRTARSVLANIEDWINSHDADYAGADAGDIVSDLADAIDAYADATDADERSDAWEDIVGAAEEIPDALEIALDDARAEREWEASTAPTLHGTFSPEPGEPAFIWEPEPTPEAVMTAVKCSELNTEWLHTRRGLVGLSRVETPRTAGLSPFVSWIWFTETGETGSVDGDAGRAMAITEAYVSMVRSGHNAPNA